VTKIHCKFPKMYCPLTFICLELVNEIKQKKMEWIYNLKFKNMKMTIYYFIKKCENAFLWIMSTLLKNDNNIILWESELWVLYLKITIILFYEKVWNDF